MKIFNKKNKETRPVGKMSRAEVVGSMLKQMHYAEEKGDTWSIYVVADNILRLNRPDVAENRDYDKASAEEYFRLVSEIGQRLEDDVVKIYRRVHNVSGTVKDSQIRSRSDFNNERHRILFVMGDQVMKELAPFVEGDNRFEEKVTPFDETRDQADTGYAGYHADDYEDEPAPDASLPVEEDAAYEHDIHDDPDPADELANLTAEEMVTNAFRSGEIDGHDYRVRLAEVCGKARKLVLPEGNRVSQQLFERLEKQGTFLGRFFNRDARVRAAGGPADVRSRPLVKAAKALVALGVLTSATLLYDRYGLSSHSATVANPDHNRVTAEFSVARGDNIMANGTLSIQIEGDVAEPMAAPGPGPVKPSGGSVSEADAVSQKYSGKSFSEAGGDWKGGPTGEFVEAARYSLSQYYGEAIGKAEPGFASEVVDRVLLPSYYDTIRGDSGKMGTSIAWSPDSNNRNASRITMSKDSLSVRDPDGKLIFVQMETPEGPEIIRNEVRGQQADVKAEKTSPDEKGGPKIFGFSMP